MWQNPRARDALGELWFEANRDKLRQIAILTVFINYKYLIPLPGIFPASGVRKECLMLFPSLFGID
jgi:hypothetical protein